MANLGDSTVVILRALNRTLGLPLPGNWNKPKPFKTPALSRDAFKALF